MGNAYIFNDHLSGADRDTIDAIVTTAGFHPLYAVPTDMSLLDPDDDIGVVGLPAAAEDLASIDAYTKAFAGAGVRVIAIWLHKEETGGTGIPDAIGKYGVTVDITSPKLSNTLKGEDVWEEAGGAPRPAPKTKRNKC